MSHSRVPLQHSDYRILRGRYKICTQLNAILCITGGKKGGGMDGLVNLVHCFYGFYYKCSIQNVKFRFYLKHLNVWLWNTCLFLLVYFCGERDKNSSNSKTISGQTDLIFGFISSVEPKLAYSHIAAFSKSMLYCLGCKTLTRKYAGKKCTQILLDLLTSLTYHLLCKIYWVAEGGWICFYCKNLNLGTKMKFVMPTWDFTRGSHKTCESSEAKASFTQL